MRLLIFNTFYLTLNNKEKRQIYNVFETNFFQNNAEIGK